MRAVLGLGQSRTPEDGMRVAGLLAEYLWDPRAEELPKANLMRVVLGAVLGLGQSRTPEDGMHVAGLLAQWLRDPRDDGLKRAFTDRVWRLAGQFEPGDADSRAAMHSGSPPSGTRV